MTRKSSAPWIHRNSRVIIGAIAILGVLETAILAIAELSGKASDICPNTGCKEVLESPYASVFGIPLPLLGLVAYGVVAILAFAPLSVNPDTQKKKRNQWERTTWSVLFAIATAMVVSSGYLMYIMVFTIGGWCPYCIASALFSLALFVLVIIGRSWDDLGQLSFVGIIVAMVTLTGVLGIYGNVNNATASDGRTGPPITQTSGEAELALARHLDKIDAKLYVSYTCPHCHEQQELFGKQAAAIIDPIECHPQGKNARPELCQEAGIRGVPAWEINGQLYSGVQPLDVLARISDYEGSQNFQYEFPYPRQ